MCGIVGAVAQREVSGILLEGLKRLEYRGYDSAGIAVIDQDNQLHRQRTQGKVKELENSLKDCQLQGSVGIAHTRWATHGEPAEHNAHPHLSSEIAIVHNGIIENHAVIRKRLQNMGYHFDSETDSEIAAHLVHSYRQTGLNLLDAVKATAKEFEGAFAFGIIDAKSPERLIAVRHGCPLVVGLGENENFIASDHIALLSVANEFIYLEEGDVVDLSYNSVTIWDVNNKEAHRSSKKPQVHYSAAEKGEFRHYMLKEIYDQPEAIKATLDGRITQNRLLMQTFGEKAQAALAKAKHVQIVACGTSYHAGLIAKYWFEEFANTNCQVEIASEYRYRTSVLQDDTLFITISQSGETADTLAALRSAKKRGILAAMSICNVAESSLVRESDFCLMTLAGVEIGVASTKAFTTQLVALLQVVIALGKQNGMTKETEAKLIHDLHQLPNLVREVLGLNDTIARLAQKFADKQHALFLGRGTQYPVALEGALKLKEISYIHAEAYPAGELKHGPLALVDKNMPVVAVAPNDALLEKLKSNLHEVRARGGLLYVFADSPVEIQNAEGVTIIPMPVVSSVMAPIIYTVPLQLLAYHVAVLKGTDVDQPRNLAKSVTVE